MSDKPTIVLCNGGIRSLVGLAATLSMVDRKHVVLLHLRPDPTRGHPRLQVIRQIADHYQITRIHVANLSLIPVPNGFEPPAPYHWPAAPAPLWHARMLMHAMALGEHLSATRVVWPIHGNADANVITNASLAALLARQLAAIDRPNIPLVDQPLLDLTDRQIIELGVHLSVPWARSWSCQLDEPRPCGRCESCRRRAAAFHAAHLVDPAEPASRAA